MFLNQTSLEQTGIALFETEKGVSKFPLFSLKPVEEARDILAHCEGLNKILHVFTSNNLLQYKIEDSIQDFQAYEGQDILPEDLVRDLASGFPFTSGFEQRFIPAVYS